VLRNERVGIKTSTASGNEVLLFELAGVDDVTGIRFDIGHGADLGKALDGRGALS